jgi:hypothetical protein
MPPCRPYSSAIWFEQVLREAVDNQAKIPLDKVRNLRKFHEDSILNKDKHMFGMRHFNQKTVNEFIRATDEINKLHMQIERDMLISYD